MPLQPGVRLGPYELIAPVGNGGMGEVYRARDTRLDRTVAVKVLPSLLATDAEFRERFDREARSVSALTHPNICTLYDVGEHRLDDGTETRYLVMEFLEGETLAARLERGALPLDEALRIATDIASALDQAHRHGIVHRDLKPANVMLTKAGAKLLDFGLAKSNPAGAISTVTTLATMTSPPGGVQTAPLTTRGTILGTLQYMSPEQVEGEEAGPRSDLFSFGVLLFEMVTGRKAFSGKSPASLLGAILKEDPPPIGQPQPMAPPALERLVKACLAKDPDDRLQSAHDVLLQLRWIQEGGSAIGLPAAVTTHRRNRERMAWIAAAVVGVLWLATLVPALRGLRTPPGEPRITFTVDTGAIGVLDAFSVAVSPDGKMLMYVASGGRGNAMLWVREFDQVEARSLAGTEGAVSPFWSPDSRSIGFASGGKLQTVNVAGGPPQTICNIPVTFYGATWNNAGTILYAHGNSSSNVSLSRVSASGGESIVVAQADRSQDQIGLLWPQFLPDGRHYVYFTMSNDPSKRAIQIASLDGGAPVTLVRSPAAARVVHGFLLYVRDDDLVAQRFDTGNLALTGEPVRLADTVLYSPASGRIAFAASTNGVLAWRAGGPNQSVAQLTWLNRSGQATQTIGDAVPYNQIRLSPDEKRVAALVPSSGTLNYRIWTVDLASGIGTELPGQESSNDPVWSPDGQSILFESVTNGKRDFYRQTVGSRAASLVYESSEDPKWLSDWSRDGRFLLYHLPRPSKLFAVPISDVRPPAAAAASQSAVAGKAILLAETPATIDGSHFSHDGNWVVYQQSDTGQFEVWVASFPAFDNRRRISSRGGGQAFWRGDGNELFYLTLDGKMMSVSVVRDSSSPGGLSFGAPVELFQSPISRPILTLDQYAVAADGQRFLFLQPRTDKAGILPITVAVNWQTGLVR